MLKLIKQESISSGFSKDWKIYLNEEDLKISRNFKY